MAVSGTLRDMDLVSIISVNCNEMNQARLLVRHQGMEASVFFDGGNIAHMSLGTLEGEEVMQEIMGWDEGTFELEQGVSAPKRTVTKGWGELLLEGMQRLDESTASDLAAEGSSPNRGRNGDEEMTPRAKAEDADVAGTIEEAGAESEKDMAARTSEEPTEGPGEGTDAAPLLDHAATAQTDLRSLARALFQMGLDRGLNPHQAALQASRTRLPDFIEDERREEFKTWLIEAYEESLRDQVETLRRDMGFK